MQTQHEIQSLLEQAGLAPRKRFGQNFLIDHNLMRKLLALADISPQTTVLEVGPATGSLTEELLQRAARVVAVEIDRGLAALLRSRLGGQERLVLICSDALAGKHAIEPAVIDALGERADLVSNLPYNIATPLVAQCLLDSWQSIQAQRPQRPICRFDRLTFTVQQEVADRLCARPDTSDYGPVSVVVALLGKVTMGPAVPPTAFWPRPQVLSRIMRIDFDEHAAARLASTEALGSMLAMAFQQRRKQIGSVIRRKHAAFEADRFAAAIHAAGIDPTSRAEKVAPEQFLSAANALARGG